QPARLALAQQNVMLAAAATQPVQTVSTQDAVDSYMPGVPANAQAVAAEAGVAPPMTEAAPVALAEAAPVAGTNAGVVFGPRAEVVQAVPAVAVRAPAAEKVSLSARAPAAIEKPSARPAHGNFYVQLGAYA
ncbi:hypothetical protein INQ23_24570, partial [Escherichia coli]|nr:hypothetical protein [Escherichia coli]